MSPSETVEFLKNMGGTDLYVVFSSKTMDVERELKRIKELGYAAFVRQTALGTELVVTEKLYSPEIAQVHQRLAEKITACHD